MSVLLILTPHLVEKIEAILAADLADQLDFRLEKDLKIAKQEAADYAVAIAIRAKSVSSIPSGIEKKTEEEREGAEEVEKLQTPDKTPVAPPPIPPATIDEETLLALSKWATSDIGPVILKRKGLDPADYSFISLLAGTEVYVSPEALERLKAAENPDKPNPFLPSYLSPQPPSLGSEYRQLIRNLSTVLNILFSIFGSAGAVYAASVGGAGYSKETAALLAILAGVVVGIADGVLVWIFSSRVGKVREEGKRLGREMGRGSAIEVKKDLVGDEGRLQGESIRMKDKKEDRKIRLRRRAVGDPSDL